MQLPYFSNYGYYSSSNYGAHTLCFTDNEGQQFYFSYSTLVAFRCDKGLFVRQNDWGPTTGKHLNWIDGGNKKQRVNEETFNELFEKHVK